MKKILIVFSLLLTHIAVNAQVVTTLQSILQTIDSNNPLARMFAAQVQSLDEAAKGARSGMPTDFSTGLWMAPYNVKMWQKGDNGATGMGQYMFSVQQMFPNKKKQDAEAAYMEAMSSTEKERAKYELNQLYAEAKKSYCEWQIILRKLAILEENAKLLDFMIKDAEIRYKNGVGKLSAYYKAKAGRGNITNTKLALESDASQKRIRLNTLMNRNKSQEFSIDTLYFSREYPVAFIDTAAIIGRSDVRAIDKEVQLAALQQTAESIKSKPDFGVRFDHMFGFGGLPMQYSLMGMARIPIGRANRMSKAAAESLRWKSEALSQQRNITINDAVGEAMGLHATLAIKKKQLTVFEDDIIPALRKNYQVILNGYQQNTEQLPELFDAWDTLNKTQLEYLDLLLQIQTMQVELEKILEIK